MRTRLRLSHLVGTTVAVLVALACETAANCQQSSWIDAAKKEEKAAATVKAALQNLGDAERTDKKARQEPPGPVGSDRERAAWQTNVNRRRDDLEKAKDEITKAMWAHLDAKRALAEAKANEAGTGPSPSTDQPPGRDPALPGGPTHTARSTPSSGRRNSDLPPPAGNARSRFHNVMGDLEGHLKETYHWVERIKLATDGELKAEVREPGLRMRPDPRNPKAILDPFELAHRSLQMEWYSDPKAPGETVTKIPEGPPVFTPQLPSVADNLALRKQIELQKNVVRDLRLKAQTDVEPHRTNFQRQLAAAERELKRLEDQLKTGR